MAMFQFNYLAGIIGFILAFVIGGLWYSEKGFGKIWLACLGYDPKTRGANPALGFAMQMVATVLNVFLIGVVVWAAASTGLVWLVPLYIIAHAVKGVASCYWSAPGWTLIALNVGYDVIIDIVIAACFAFIPLVF
ncbi:MAG: hypothetical protein QM537_08400 [Candidatus Symbiobacter sp.]|nr:hypothetical protein [Candidatus Symbiobacter sp.]